MKTKELNLCEILKDCPKGAKLYSPIFGVVKFDYIDYANDLICILYTDIENELKSGYFQFNGCYINAGFGDVMLFPSKKNYDWNTFVVPKQKVEHFDPKTLKPFDKVLVRDNIEQNWRCDFFSFFYTTEPKIVCKCVTDIWKYTIPYNDYTKHLVGTTNEAPEYYKYWE